MTFSDVLLHCMDTDWELHRAYLQKSIVLSEILKAAENPKHTQYYNMQEADPLHKHIKKGALYSNDYHCTKHAEIGRPGNPKRGGKSVDRSQYSRFRVNNVTVIELEITDPLVTEHGQSIAVSLVTACLYMSVIFTIHGCPTSCNFILKRFCSIVL